MPVLSPCLLLQRSSISSLSSLRMAMRTSVALYLGGCILIAGLAAQDCTIWRAIIVLQCHCAGQNAGVYQQRLLLCYKAPASLAVRHLHVQHTQITSCQHLHHTLTSTRSKSSWAVLPRLAHCRHDPRRQRRAEHWRRLGAMPSVPQKPSQPHDLPSA